MSVKTASYQIGLSEDPNNNFTLVPDGAGGLLIQRGNAGSPIEIVLKVGSVPAVSVRKNAAQTIPTGTYTKIDFQTIEYDFTTAWSSARFQPGVPGIYRIDSNIFFTPATANDSVGIYLFKNGVRERDLSYRTGVTGTYIVSPSSQITMNTTDYIEIYMDSINGGSLSYSGADMTRFMASLVRADT